MSKTFHIAPNCHECFMVPREQMPQLDKEGVKTFLADNNVPNEVVEVPTSSLKPTQGEFNLEKIESMNNVGMSIPILVSKDNYVLDGHHRWLANHYKGNKIQKIIRLPWDAALAVSKMNEHSMSFNKGIHEEAGAAVSIGGGAMDNTVAPVSKKRQLLIRRKSTG